MKREDKYPDTTTFHYYNANPKNRITEDCVVRAICTALEQDYNETLMEMAELSCKNGYSMVGSKGIDEYLKSKGWIKHKQPRKADNTKYTGKEFCKLLSHDITAVGRNIIANIGGSHTVAIIGGKVYDIWDSTDGCIGNYWTKE